MRPHRPEYSRRTVLRLAGYGLAAACASALGGCGAASDPARGSKRVGSAPANVTAGTAAFRNTDLGCGWEPTGSLDSRSARILLESLSTLNAALHATILMVTHDAFTASYCGRILFIKDGKLFSELRRGEASRREFFEHILEVVSLLGGEGAHAL